MEYLLIFLFSFAFFNYLAPMLDILSTWFVNAINLKIVKSQVEAEKVKGEIEEEPEVHACGFQYDNNEEEEWEEEDDE